MHHACPHHAIALTRHTFNGRLTWRCEHCDGLWVAGKVVRELVKNPQWPGPSSLRATDLRCPDDQRALSACTLRGIELDLCAHCHGVWLDRGELETILARSQQGDAATEDRGWHEDVAEGVVDVVDLVARRGRLSITATAEPPPLPSQVSELPGQHFEVEYDTPPPLPGADVVSTLLDSHVSVADIDPGLFDGIADVADFAGDAIGAVFEFIGEAFSSL